MSSLVKSSTLSQVVREWCDRVPGLLKLVGVQNLNHLGRPNRRVSDLPGPYLVSRPEVAVFDQDSVLLTLRAESFRWTFTVESSVPPLFAALAALGAIDMR